MSRMFFGCETEWNDACGECEQVAQNDSFAIQMETNVNAQNNTFELGVGGKLTFWRPVPSEAVVAFGFRFWCLNVNKDLRFKKNRKSSSHDSKATKRVPKLPTQIKVSIKTAASGETHIIKMRPSSSGFFGLQYGSDTIERVEIQHIRGGETVLIDKVRHCVPLNANDSKVEHKSNSKHVQLALTARTSGPETNVSNTNANSSSPTASSTCAPHDTKP